MADRALNPRHARFIQGLLNGRSQKQAYIDAGFKARGHAAEVNAERLLRKAEIKAALTESQAKRAQRTEVTADRVVKELARLAFVDPQAFVEPTPGSGNGSKPRLKSILHLDRDTAAAIAEFQVDDDGVVRPKRLHSKERSLKLLGQHLGLFKERDPLEVLLGFLPPELSRAVRAELARLVSGGGDPAGSGAGDPSPAAAGAVGEEVPR